MSAPVVVRAPRTPKQRAARIAVAGAALLLLVSLPWLLPMALSGLSFFRVRKVEIRGAVYLPPSEVLGRLRLDSSASVWDDRDPLVERLEQHPQIRHAAIQRKLPGTLVVRVEENLPVALVPVGRGFTAIDGRGKSLPIDPSRTALDLPILASRDTALARTLAELRAGYPSLFARVSEIRREGRSELLVRLPGMRVRALADLTADRLGEVVAVEADLARRHLRVAELDLRYRDQVIARIQ